MNFSEYGEQTGRTWNQQDKTKDLLHIYLGLGDELGELKSCFKKNIGYGRELDKVNLLEEAGDFMYFALRGHIFFEDPQSLKISSSAHSFTAPLSNIQVVNVLASMSRNVEAFFVAASLEHKDNALLSLTLALYDLKKLLFGFGYSLEQAMEANIAKLTKRYPEKWTAEAALNRDLKTEREVLNSHV